MKNKKMILFFFLIASVCNVQGMKKEGDTENKTLGNIYIIGGEQQQDPFYFKVGITESGDYMRQLKKLIENELLSKNKTGVRAPDFSDEVMEKMVPKELQSWLLDEVEVGEQISFTFSTCIKIGNSQLWMPLYFKLNYLGYRLYQSKNSSVTICGDKASESTEICIHRPQLNNVIINSIFLGTLYSDFDSANTVFKLTVQDKKEIKGFILPLIVNSTIQQYNNQFNNKFGPEEKLKKYSNYRNMIQWKKSSLPTKVAFIKFVKERFLSCHGIVLFSEENK